MEERGTAVIAATRVVAALSLLLVPDRADAAELDLELADPDLELVAIDSDPKESFLAIHLDTAGRIFVGGREAIFLYEPGDGGGYRPRRELVRFPPHSWVYDLTVRGRDLYALTISSMSCCRRSTMTTTSSACTRPGSFT